MVLRQPGHIVHETLSPKVTSSKWTGGMAQEVESLLGKSKAMSSNPSYNKCKKKKEKKEKCRNIVISSVSG
jgi:hypothetical protein